MIPSRSSQPTLGGSDTSGLNTSTQAQHIHTLSPPSGPHLKNNKNKSFKKLHKSKKKIKFKDVTQGDGSGSTWETKAKPPQIKCHPSIHGSPYLGKKSIKIPHIEVIEKLQFFIANENENMTKIF